MGLACADGSLTSSEGTLQKGVIRRQDGLRGIIQRASLTPGDALLVGDSAIDLATARNAGTRSCLARYGFGFNDTTLKSGSGEHVIDSPAALVPLVDSLNGIRSSQN